MEHRLVRIPSPALAVGRIGTEYMIVGEEVFVAEILGGLSVVSDGFRVGPYLSLWESHAYLHTQPPLRDASRIHKGVIHLAVSPWSEPNFPQFFDATLNVLQAHTLSFATISSTYRPASLNLSPGAPGIRMVPFCKQLTQQRFIMIRDDSPSRITV